MNYSYHIILAFLWIAYGCLHSIMASLWFKKEVEKHTGKYFKWYRLFYSCFAALLLGLVLLYQYSHQSFLLYSVGTTFKVIASSTAILGLVIMAIAIKRYFFLLSGISVLTKEDKKYPPLRQGINAHMRHPLYSGTLLFLWSLFFLFPFLNNLIACVVITVYTLIGIKLEENKLLIEFGDFYRSYKKKVPMLIPSFSKKNI